MELLGRGFACTGTSDSLPEAASFVQTVEKRQRQKIAEEIAFLNGWKRRLAELGRNLHKNTGISIAAGTMNEPNTLSQLATEYPSQRR